MRVQFGFQRGLVVGVLLSTVGIAVALILTEPRVPAMHSGEVRRPTGSPQLVSVEPLPAMDGEMCQWMPASARAFLLLL
jgi:hypothetical protein